MKNVSLLNYILLLIVVPAATLLADDRSDRLKEISSHLVQVMTTTQENLERGDWSIDRVGVTLLKLVPADKKVHECEVSVDYLPATHQHSAKFSIKVEKIDQAGNIKSVEISRGGVSKEAYIQSFLSTDKETNKIWISLPGWFDAMPFPASATLLEENDLEIIRKRTKGIIMSGVETRVTARSYSPRYSIVEFWDYGADKLSFADDKTIFLALNFKDDKAISIAGISVEAGMKLDHIDNRVDIKCGEI